MSNENGKYENGKYKNRKPYPNEYIEQFFELLKILPPKIKLSELSVKSTDNQHSWQDEGRQWRRIKLPFEKWTAEARFSLYEQLEELPTEFQDYIWGAEQVKPKYNPLIENSDEDFDIKKLWHPTLEAAIRYEDFRSLISHLRLMIEFVEKNLSVEKQPSIPQTQMLPIIGQIKFQLNKHNKIEIVPSGLSRALEGIDATLVRECKQRNCRRLFWAGRVDQQCCSAKCREAWKKQRKREKLKNNRVAVNGKSHKDK